MEGDLVRIAPKLPVEWTELDFPLVIHGNPLRVSASHEKVTVENRGSGAVRLILMDKVKEIAAGEKTEKALSLSEDGS